MYGVEKARDMVLKWPLGNLRDLAGDLEVEALRRRRGGAKGKTKGPAGWRKSPQGTASKPPKGYFTPPFRSWGTELLCPARCPRAQSPPSTGAPGWGWGRGLHEPAVARVEGDGGSPTRSTVAEVGSALEMEGTCSQGQGRGRTPPRQGGPRRDGEARRCWGLCPSGGSHHIPGFPHPQERRGTAVDPRSEGDQPLSGASQVQPERGEGGWGCREEQQVLGCHRPAARLPAGSCVNGCKKVPRGEMGETRQWQAQCCPSASTSSHTSSLESPTG